MAKALKVVDSLLEQEDDDGDFDKDDVFRLLGPERKKTSNLGWILRNWKRVQSLSFEALQPPGNEGELVADLRGGEAWSSEFSSTGVCWNFLDRPVFRGLPFTLHRLDGRSEQFVVGDPRWKALTRLAYNGGVTGYRSFMQQLGFDPGIDYDQYA